MRHNHEQASYCIGVETKPAMTDWGSPAAAAQWRPND
jgi:hypothetical protein